MSNVTSEKNPRIRAINYAVFLLALSACFTSFTNSLVIKLKNENDVTSEVFRIADGVAQRRSLKRDQRLISSTDQRGYFGAPYHYYRIKIGQTSSDVVVAEYTHEARMANKASPRNEPVDDFLEAIKTEFGPQVLLIQHGPANDSQENPH